MSMFGTGMSSLVCGMVSQPVETVLLVNKQVGLACFCYGLGLAIQLVI